MKKIATPTNESRLMDNDLDIDELLAESKRQSADFDTSRLQKRIIELTDGLPQATSQTMRNKKSPFDWWHRIRDGINERFHDASFSWRGTASVACILLVLVAVAPMVNEQLQSPVSVAFESSEQGLLTEQELASDDYDGLVWQELVLLEEEIAFAAL